MIRAALGKCELAQREVQYINRHGEEGACGRSRRTNDGRSEADKGRKERRQI